MDYFIGLDVSMKETAISIRRAGARVWRGKCASDPKLIAELVHKRAPDVKRVVFETGPLSVWFYHALRAECCNLRATYHGLLQHEGIKCPRLIILLPPSNAHCASCERICMMHGAGGGCRWLCNG